MRVGVLSDTHNLLRPRVLELLDGCDRILHAGDVGDLHLLEPLRRIAPVEAIRGNTDTGETAAALPDSLAGDLDGVSFLMVHRREEADPNRLRNLGLLIYGHSHRPELSWHGSCLLLNPGLSVAHLPQFERETGSSRAGRRSRPSPP